jgi:glycerol-3-phosphate dehydrogenase
VKAKPFDVVIVGAGVIGAAIARELSRYDLRIAIVERNVRVAQETSAGNSGVVHGGFDPTPGTLNAELNILGRKIYEEEWFKELSFPYQKVDSMVVAFDATEGEEIRNLYAQGLANGLAKSELKILNQQQCLALEPNLNPEVVGALLCTSSYIVDPVLLTTSLVANAAANGVKLFLGHAVRGIASGPKGFVVEAGPQDKGVEFKTQFVINAAGHYADVIAEMIGDRSFTLMARRGQYRIIEKTEREVINDHILFMTPTIHGKGVIVAPMLDGHLLVGPTAENDIPKEDTRLVTVEKFEEIGVIGKKIVPSLRMEKTCRVLSGSRSICVETDDFVVAPSEKNPRFINVAGISSPGLSAAPAIARRVIAFIKSESKLAKKRHFIRKQAAFIPTIGDT